LARFFELYGKMNNMKKAVFTFVAALFSTMLVLAQDETKKVDIDVNTKGDNWYASPWVWIVGAAVFILLLVALTRGSRRSD
jgi:hypothetical protein